VLPALSLLLSLSLLQSPQAPRPTGTGVIVGRVVDGVSGQRLSGVTVLISGAGITPAEKTVTDGDGQFTFRSLPAGALSIAAKRGGYIEGHFGQHRPGGAARALTLGAGERRDDVLMELFKPSAITGTVIDDAGEPVVKVAVRAYRRTFVCGHPALTEADATMTDDRGVYRLSRLLPGEYVVAEPLMTGSSIDSGETDAPMVRDGGSSASHLPPSDGKTQKFPTTYYAAGQTAPQATIITLGIGDIRRDADLILRPGKVMNISGNITMTRGASRGVQMTLVAVGEDDISGDRSTATAITGEAGTFSFASIPAGQYVLRALARPAGAEPAQWAELPVALNDKDLNDVALYLRSGSTISGRFELDGPSDDTSTWLTGLTFTLEPMTTRYAGAPPPKVMLDASRRTFTFANVLPGRYAVRVGATSDNAVKSVTSQGRDVWLSPLTVDASDITGVVVTLTSRLTALSGTVTGSGDLSEARVLVFPQDAQGWTDFGPAAANVRLLSVTAAGSYEVKGLPAGDYWAVAIDQDVAARWQSPGFLLTAARVATRVRVGEGERPSTDLKIVTIK